MTNDVSLFYNRIVLESEIENPVSDKNIGIDFAIELHKKMTDRTIARYMVFL